MELKITRIGNSLGVILPRDLLTRLKLDKGDSVFLTETPEGYRYFGTLREKLRWSNAVGNSSDD